MASTASTASVAADVACCKRGDLIGLPDWSAERLHDAPWQPQQLLHSQDQTPPGEVTIRGIWHLRAQWATLRALGQHNDDLFRPLLWARACKARGWACMRSPCGPRVSHGIEMQGRVLACIRSFLRGFSLSSTNRPISTNRRRAKMKTNGRSSPRVSLKKTDLQSPPRA